MAYERTCMMCGENYKYCSHCHDFDPTETWKYLFHDKDCLAISKIWYAYRGNEITKEEARRQMEKYPERMQKIFKYTTIAAKEIRAIFDIPEETEVPNDQTKTEEPKETVEEKADQQVEKQVFNKPHKNNYKNYKR